MSKFTVSQTSFNAGELSPYMSARLDQARRSSGCKSLKNMLITPHGAVFRRSGFRFMGEALDHNPIEKNSNNNTLSSIYNIKVRLIPFVFNEDQAYLLEFSAGKLRIWHKDALLKNPTTNQEIVITTPFTDSVLPYLRCCQSGNTMYLVNPKVAPQKLLRLSETDWQLSGMTFSGTIPIPQNVKIVKVGSGSVKHAYVVTAVNIYGEESLPSVEISGLCASPLTATAYMTLTWNTVAEATTYNVYKQGGGAGVYGLISSGIVGLSFSDKGQSVNFNSKPPRSSILFNAPDSYPSCVQFYQQRLCFAASNKEPQTIWMSKAGTAENFNISNPLRDDDAITLTLASEKANAIRWLMSGKRLLVGTVDSEWAVSGRGGTPISPMSCEAERQSARGSSELQPQTVGDSVLFVQRGGNLVRELRYNLEIDGYAGADITILAEHLFRNRVITDWAFQQHPYSVVWCILDDGSLVGLTIISEHQIAGWHTHTSQGRFEGLCTIPGVNGDELWVVIMREIKDKTTGNTIQRRYIEKLETPFNSNHSQTGFFVDSGITYLGEATDSVNGLEHLEGLEVSILADGWVHPNVTVTQGKVSLKHKAQKIHIGLGYKSDLQLMPIEASNSSGICLNTPKRAVKAFVRILDSAGFLIGTNEETLKEIQLRKVQNRLGVTLPLFSGDCSAYLKSSVNNTSSLLLRQEEPLPFTVLATSLEIELGVDT